MQFRGIYFDFSAGLNFELVYLKNLTKPFLKPDLSGKKKSGFFQP